MPRTYGLRPRQLDAANVRFSPSAHRGRAKHMRSVTVRIISDNDKRSDNGSAIARLASADIEGDLTTRRSTRATSSRCLAARPSPTAASTGRARRACACVSWSARGRAAPPVLVVIKVGWNVGQNESIHSGRSSRPRACVKGGGYFLPLTRRVSVRNQRAALVCVKGTGLRP